MASSQLLGSLRKLRHRVVAVGSASGVGWGLTAALGVLLVGVWLDLVWELPGGVRAGCGTLAAAAVVALAVAASWNSLRHVQPVVMARRLDQVARTRGQILAGVDLLGQTTALQPLSAALAELAVDRAAKLAARVDHSRAVPTQQLRWSLGTFGGLSAFALLLGLLMPRLAWTQWLRFTDPFGDHPPFSRVSFQVEPGDTQIVYGKGLDIKVTTDGPPVEEVQLVLQTEGVTSGEKLPMFPGSDGQWTTSVATVTNPAEYFVRADRARSRRYRIEVITVPRLEAVRFRVTPPAYTSQSPYEGELPQGGLSGLPGTKVEVWAKSNRPLSGGSVEIVSGESRTQVRLAPSTLAQSASPTNSDPPLTPGAPGLRSTQHSPLTRDVTGSFQITNSGRMELKVTDVAGQDSQESFTAPITLLADERPFVRVLQPPPVSFATPDVDLPVVVSAEDDYGISRLQLFRGMNESRDQPADIPLDSPPPKRWEATEGLALTSYGLSPGDVIKLYARVEDNDPAGAKGSESSVAKVQIISQEDFERLLRQREGIEVLMSKYQQAERRLESLAEEIERLQKELAELPPDSELAEAKRKQLEELTRRLEEEAKAVREAAEHELPYDIDKNLTKHLEKVAESMEDAAREARELAETPALKAGQASEALKKMGERLKQERKEFEKQAIEPLEHLAAAYPLMEDEARFVELYQRQRELAERLASLQGQDGKDDPKLKARMRDLEAEQHQLREELSDLSKDIEDHAARLPDDPAFDKLRSTASDFARGLRTSGAAEAMANAEAGLAEFSGTQGHGSAKEAADILEQFLGKCSGMGKEGEAGNCLAFKPSLSECLGNTVEQLLADAGLKPGNKPCMGEGSGGGQSSRRSSLQNVGLYGKMPALGPTARTGFGQNRLGVPGRGAKGEHDKGSDPSVVGATGELRATGAGATGVPLQYRRRVSQYFERIADETGGK